MDTASAERLSHVHPVLAAKVIQIIENIGFDCRVVSGLRTYQEQDALYAQGRSKAGDIVTNARAGYSNHNFGLACDLAPFAAGQPDWKDNGKFLAIGQEAHSVGLEWGGDWAKFLDKPHVQLHGPDLKTCRALFAQGGLAAVWAKVGGSPAPIVTPPITPVHFDRILRPGSRGSDVTALQQALIAKGFPIKADGDYGPATERAVRAFQASHKLQADGLCGNATREALGL